MGWLGTMDAALTTLRPFENSADGTPNPKTPIIRAPVAWMEVVR